MALPIINLSLIPVFPAKVSGDGPVTIIKNGLEYVVGWDIETFSVNPNPGANSVVLSHDPDANETGLISISDIATPVIDSRLADQATAEAGADNVKLMTPLRTKQSIDANASDTVQNGALAGGVIRNKTGSWPEPLNAINTTMSHTDGSPIVTVPSGLDTRDGDTVTAPSVLPYMTYIVSGGGTTALTLSRNCVGDGSVAVMIGNDRWDIASTTIGDTAGFRRLYIGEPARGRSTMMNRINGAGLDYQQVTAMSVENEFGGVGAWFGSRMSKEATGLNGLISVAEYTLVDEDPVDRNFWTRYEQMVLQEGTEPSGVAMAIQAESSLETYWPVVDINPYNYNPAGSTRNYRFDIGIGNYAERGEPTPNKASAFIDFVWNGNTARKGLVFGHDSLDVSSGSASALALAQKHAIDWFSSDNDVSWRVVSMAASGNAYVLHTLGLVTLGETDLAISRPAGIGSSIYLRADNIGRFTIKTGLAESGGDSGSDFFITRSSDAGSYLGIPFGIRRSNGRIRMDDLAASTSFANDAAAAAGGVAVNELYRNGSAVNIRVS